MELSNNIAYLRKKIGLSQEGLAEKLNLSRQAIAKWENGSSEPNVSALVKMSDLFGISIDKLILKQYCKPANNITVSDSSTDKLPLRIVELSGYDISDMVLNFTESGIVTVGILYTVSPFDGVIFPETPINYGITVKPNHESLKRLFYKISVNNRSKDDWYLITDTTPDDMEDFISWLKKDFEDIDKIETLYILYEENPNYNYSYDYNNVSLFGLKPPSPADFESEMSFLKSCMQMQEYEGPFPPARIYKRLLEDAPGYDLPHWFMTGDFSK